ncbi:MAG: ATP cone domain-containing protein [Candidatus Micrarchaeota archaeon]
MSTPRIRFVTKRDGLMVPFDPARITNAIHKAVLAVEPHRGEAKAREIASKFSSEVVDNLRSKCASDEAPHVETIQDILIEVLHHDLARGKDSYSSRPESLWMAYMLYREGHRLVRNGEMREEDFHPDARPTKKLDSLRMWNKAHDCDTVEGLNRWLSGRHLNELIRGAERRSIECLRGVVSRLGRAIEEGGLRAIVITGPSSSGKTVTTRKMLRLLKETHPGVAFKALEVDNYFRDKSTAERFHYNVDGAVVEDPNFELPSTYDIALLNEHLEALMRGEGVLSPKYDFISGQRTGEMVPFSLERGEVLLIDCMHALYPPMTEAIPQGKKFKLYLEPLAVLEDMEKKPVYFTDIRLLRRMKRDKEARGHSIEATLMHWHLVRKGERYILPFVHSADAIIDTGLPYELAALKAEVERDLRAVLPLFQRNEDLFDGMYRGERVLNLLSQIASASPGQIGMIPPDSVLREFIGGSVFFPKVR